MIEGFRFRSLTGFRWFKWFVSIGLQGSVRVERLTKSQAMRKILQ